MKYAARKLNATCFSIYFEAVNYKTTEFSTQLESFSPNNKKWSRFMFHSFRSDERRKRTRKRRLEIKGSSLHKE
jgi:hypothetical protein